MARLVVMLEVTAMLLLATFIEWDDVVHLTYTDLHGILLSLPQNLPLNPKHCMCYSWHNLSRIKKNGWLSTLKSHGVQQKGRGFASRWRTLPLTIQHILILQHRKVANQYVYSRLTANHKSKQTVSLIEGCTMNGLITEIAKLPLFEKRQMCDKTAQ